MRGFLRMSADHGHRAPPSWPTPSTSSDCAWPTTRPGRSSAPPPTSDQRI